MTEAVRTNSQARKSQDFWSTAIRGPVTLGPIGLSISVYTDLHAVELDWLEFEQHADGTVFQTFEWLTTWQRHIGVRRGVQPVIVIGRVPVGRMLFLLPLATQPMWYGRELVWLGSELCDYNGPLLAADFATTFGSESFAHLWGRIVASIRRDACQRFDLIRLEKMPAKVGGQPNPMHYLRARLNPSGAYLTTLQATWDAFYAAKRSSGTRRRDRAKRKHLSSFGELRLCEPGDQVAALQAMQTLMEQKGQSFAQMGVGSIFERPGYSEFYRSLATDSKLSHLVHVSQLNVGSQTVAVNLGLTFQERYYHLLASYTGNREISRHGPGAAHLHDLMRQAIERGFKYFDFTIGDESYKSDWCEVRLPLYDHLHAVTLWGQVVALAVGARQKLKRMIKQTPLLWRLFSRGRAAVGKRLGLKTPRSE